jgi:hypothetical protein
MLFLVTLEKQTCEQKIVLLRKLFSTKLKNGTTAKQTIPCYLENYVFKALSKQKRPIFCCYAYIFLNLHQLPAAKKFKQNCGSQ